MKGKISYKWHIFAAFLLFAAILLVLLWVLQTVYLDSFYKNIKRTEVRSALEKEKEILDDPMLPEKTDELMQKYDLLITVLDENGYVISVGDDSPFLMSREEFLYYVLEAKRGGGYAEIDVIGDIRDEDNPFLPFKGNKGDSPNIGRPQNPLQSSVEANELFRDRMKYFSMYGQSVVAVEQTVSAQNKTCMVVVKSLISPLDTTVKMLRLQLIYVSVIMIVLALGMAFFIARYVSGPIVRMNDAAKRLGEGHYDVKFEDGSFKELSQLAGTMNVTASELAQTERLRQELIANVSHDLRTPLTMIKAYAELMRDIPGENTSENVQVIIDETEYLSGLVNDLLDISKLQSGVAELSPECFNLTEDVREAVDRSERLLGEEYSFHFEPGQEVFVTADRKKIGQVFSNYLNNAVSYAGEKKEVWIRQRLRQDRVRIEVKDEGCGIAPEELPFVWERYYRTNNNHERAAAGTGLGLSIVKKIMDLHGADCGAESTPGQGSTFWFELPVNRDSMNS